MLGRLRAKLGLVWPSSTPCRSKVGPNLVDFGPNEAKIGRNGLSFSQFRRGLSKLAQIWQISSQTSVNSGDPGPDSTGVGLNSSDVGPDSTRLRRFWLLLARFPPKDYCLHPMSRANPTQAYAKAPTRFPQTPPILQIRRRTARRRVHHQRQKRDAAGEKQHPLRRFLLAETRRWQGCPHAPWMLQSMPTCAHLGQHFLALCPQEPTDRARPDKQRVDPRDIC